MDRKREGLLGSVSQLRRERAELRVVLRERDLRIKKLEKALREIMAAVGTSTEAYHFARDALDD